MEASERGASDTQKNHTKEAKPMRFRKLARLLMLNAACCLVALLGVHLSSADPPPGQPCAAQNMYICGPCQQYTSQTWQCCNMYSLVCCDRTCFKEQCYGPPTWCEAPEASHYTPGAGFDGFICGSDGNCKEAV